MLNCQKTVSDKIKSYRGVLGVKVDLKSGIAEIDSKQFIEIEEISELLGQNILLKVTYLYPKKKQSLN